MIKKFNDFLNEAEESKDGDVKKDDKQPNLIFYGHKRQTNDGLPYFDAIYSSPFGTKLCGDGEIYELTFEILKDKEKDKAPIEYWGWLDLDNRISMVFPKYFLFNMCFPGGAKKAEELEEGKRVKLGLTAEKIFRENETDGGNDRTQQKTTGVLGFS